MLNLSAPLKDTISSENIIPTAISTSDNMIVIKRDTVKAWQAPSLSPLPILMAAMVAPPMGNVAETATTNVINGTAIFTAPSAAAPTPRPTNIPSATL